MADLKFSQRKAGSITDLVHVLFGGAIVVLAALAIFDPGKYKKIFPVIFLFAAIIYFVTAWFVSSSARINRKKHSGGIVYLIIGILALGLAVISAVSIWGNP